MRIISCRQVKSGVVDRAVTVEHAVILTNQFKIPRKLKKKLYGTRNNRKFLTFKTQWEAYSFSSEMRKYRKYKHPLKEMLFKYDVLGVAYNQ